MKNIVIVVIIIAVGVVWLNLKLINESNPTQEPRNSRTPQLKNPATQELKNPATQELKNPRTQEQILYYTCSMHPSVKVSPEEYKKGTTNCPICSMPLISVKGHTSTSSVTEGSSLREETVVKLTRTEAMLANVQVVPAKIQSIYKEIRTVGQVAYDPGLVVAQEEFVAALQSRDYMLKGASADVLSRASRLLVSARRRLQLLGMSREQIRMLEQRRNIDTDLLLPEKSAWVYADVYEHESSWVKPGQQVMIHTETAPGKIFNGTIKAIDPIINSKTRTLRARIEVPEFLSSGVLESPTTTQELKNPRTQELKKLKPNTYVDVYIKAPFGRQLSIPKTAVLDTGARKIVYVAQKNNSYVQKEVNVGPEAIMVHGEHKIKVVPVYSGLKPGQLVVNKANFLIDSQSQIGAAASAYGGSLGDSDAPMPPGHVY